MTAAGLDIHAGCVVIGEAGVLITGASGAGKSTLARTLVAAVRAEGQFAALVADDRVRLSRAGGRVVARPHPRIAGLLEVRGVGILQVPFEPAACLALVADLGDEPASRLPDAGQATTQLLGRDLPLLRLDNTLPIAENATLVRFFMANATLF